MRRTIGVLSIIPSIYTQLLNLRLYVVNYPLQLLAKIDILSGKRSLSLRCLPLKLEPPRNHPHRQRLQPLLINVILAQEENPPTEVEPIRWLLFTTLAVTSCEDVIQCVRWYSYRWLIERYHFVLKSGCRLEQLQLETAPRIHRALATYKGCGLAVVMADLSLACSSSTSL